MSIFGLYFVTELLRQAGWPRRRGLFNSEAVVDTLIADSAIDQMVNWSAIIGAYSPKRALQVIAEMFHDRDWEGENAPRILDFISGAKDRWNAQDSKTPPSDIVKPFRLSKHFGKMISMKDLKDSRIRTALEQICLEGLLWGLANPDRFKIWYESEEKSQRENLPLMKKIGVEIDSPQPLSDCLKDSEEILDAYEKKGPPFPAIPSKLLTDARALGREIND